MSLISENKKLKELTRIMNMSSGCFRHEAILTAQLKKHVEHANKIFELETNQTFLLTNMIYLHLERDMANLHNLANHFRCRVIDLLQYVNDIKVLLQKNYIKKSNKRDFFDDDDPDSFSMEYQVSPEIMSYVVEGGKLPDLTKNNTFQNYNEVVNCLEGLKSHGDHDWKSYEHAVKDILNRSKNVPLIAKVLDQNLDIMDTVIFLKTIMSTIYFQPVIELNAILSDFLRSRAIHRRMLLKFASGSNDLLEKNLLLVEGSDDLDNLKIRLSKKSMGFLKSLGIIVKPAFNLNRDDILFPDRIREVPLFFNEEENELLEELHHFLKDENMRKIEERMQERGRNAAFTILLHGPSGTGKTEAVKQLARLTNRYVLKVDISETKTPWYGQSEKLVKKIFNEYKQMKNAFETVPILLFNEADAMFTKRRGIHQSSDQTDNRIQNILLEELENFEGILVATTNFESSFDEAFERRFLYRIHVKNPDKDVRKKILSSRFPQLSQREVAALAADFELSGGLIYKIENKMEMSFILNGTAPSAEVIRDLCHKEIGIDKQRNVIGFKMPE